MLFSESFFGSGLGYRGCKGAGKWILIPLDENQASCFLKFLVLKLS